MLRVAELIRHAMAELLSRGDVNDPVLETNVITVPKVRMSPDLKLATVFVMPLGGKDTEPVIAALERNKRFLRGEVARMINLKFAPDVRFKVDDSFENASKIDQLLNSDKVRKDLASQTDDDADDAA
jgi:ribosome-binding factor A